jgi:hypothetical protein
MQRLRRGQGLETGRDDRQYRPTSILDQGTSEEYRRRIARRSSFRHDRGAGRGGRSGGAGRPRSPAVDGCDLGLAERLAGDDRRGVYRHHRLGAALTMRAYGDFDR